MSESFLLTLHSWDSALVHAVNIDWRHPFFDWCMPLLSDPALLWYIILTILAALLLRSLWITPRKRYLSTILIGAMLIGASVGVTDLFTYTNKCYFGRLRPHQSLPGIYHLNRYQGWITTPADFTPYRVRGDSFFSAHASNTMALAVAVGRIIPATAPFIYALPLAVGYSRLYLGKHFPSDVGIGWLAGWCMARLVLLLYRFLATHIAPGLLRLNLPVRNGHCAGGASNESHISKP